MGRSYCDLGFGKLRLIMDLAFISLMYSCACVCLLVCMSVCVYCFLGNVWNIRLTGRVSSHHSLLNVFFRGGEMYGLVGDESDHQTCHISPDQPIAMHQKIALQ